MTDPNRITLAEAARYIEELNIACTSNTRLSEVLLDNSFGATIPVSAFLNGIPSGNPGEKGMKAWICESTENHVTKLRLSFHSVDDYHPNDQDNSHEMPNPMQIVPFDNTFSFNMGNNNSFEDYLKNHVDVPVPSNSESKTSILNLSQDFKAGIGAENNIFQGKSAFFKDDNPNEFQSFLSQTDDQQNPIQYVRYYFGWDYKATGYFLRILMFGVDSNFSNLVGHNSIILERSHPPLP